MAGRQTTKSGDTARIPKVTDWVMAFGEQGPCIALVTRTTDTTDDEVRADILMFPPDDTTHHRSNIIVLADEKAARGHELYPVNVAYWP